MRFNSVLFVLILFGISCFACGGSKKQIHKREDYLKKSAEYYNTQIRWKNFGEASDYVDPKKVDDFIQKYENSREQLHIVDIRLVSTKVDKEDKNKGVSRVMWTYYFYPNPSLKKELMVQNWHYDEEAETWYIEIPEIEALKKP